MEHNRLVIFSAIFVKKIGSGTHRVTQKSVRKGEVLVISMPGKKRFHNTVAACVLLRKNFQNGILAHSITKMPLVILLPIQYHSNDITDTKYHEYWSALSFLFEMSLYKS
jgi:hypothetical protein